MAQLLSAGLVLEDVALWKIPGNNELLLAALAPAAGKLKSLCIYRLYTGSNMQLTKDQKVSRHLSMLHDVAADGESSASSGLACHTTC